MSFHHVPVLKEAVLAALRPAAGETHVDCTLGGGGHAESLLEAADCTVIGLDRDPAAITAASARLARFEGRFIAVHSRFSELPAVLDRLGVPLVHGILADLGVSSHQIDEARRGFSFRGKGPLDMRMDPTRGPTADEVVNSWPEADLVQIIFKYGEDKHARRIARRIVEGRPWTDTVHLADALRELLGSRERIHPATRAFQAIRIAINDELGEVSALLPVAIERLRPGGRLAVISFHSLEDRIVKQFLQRESGRGVERDAWGHPIVPPRMSAPTDVAPTEEEAHHNPRARSARLRTASRLPWTAP